MTVSGGTVTSRAGAEEHSIGERVLLVIRCDAADEVHVHGYDATAACAPGRPARLAFRADIPGVFEVELEGSGLKLLDLTVR